MTTSFATWLRTDGPRWPYLRIWLHALISAIGLTAATWVVCRALGMALPEIFAENAAHELLQSLVLGVAVVAAVVALAWCSGLTRFAAVVTGLISYIGFLREIPSCRGDVMIFCADSTTRGFIMAAGGLSLVVAAVFFEIRARGTIKKAIHPRLSWPLALAAALVGASQISEDLHLMALEEALELYSYLVLMLITCWLALRPSSFLDVSMVSPHQLPGNHAARPKPDS